jgi:succinate-semialdehyde dehydrogenase / glutarate-semialdehyde dehydrogenase
MNLRSINPANGRTIAEHEVHASLEVERRVTRAARTYQEWRRHSFAERATVLRAAAERLRTERDAHARLMTEEMGKPIAQAEAEVEKSAWVCEHYAENAARDLAPEDVATDGSKSYIRYDPIGVLLAVMPWNFPFWQVFRAAAPALMAGNVVLLKHASNVPGCALAIERVFREAGAPEGAFTTLLIGPQAAADLVDRAEIAAVTLTGSEGAGIALARRAGGAIKKSVMELGGSDPFVVLADADAEAVAIEACAARIINNGQSCIAAKRFIVESPIADRFEAAFAAAMRNLTIGDPLDRANRVGPLARADLAETLDVQVRASVRSGARLAAGGERPKGIGFFYAPTVLTAVEPGMVAFDEETFGPVAAVTRARDAEHAVELANHSRFGLGASLWTRDLERAERLAGEIEAGAVFINGMVKSDPRLPFGGVKKSGYGRELSWVGIREFVNVKSVWMK